MKTRKWKKTGIILGILAILCIIVVLIIPKVLDLNQYNDRIVSEIEKATGGKATLGSVSWGLSNGLWLEADNFSIKDASAFPVDIEIARLYVKASILPLLSKKVELKTVMVESPVIKVSLEPDMTADQKITPSDKESEAIGPETGGSPLLLKYPLKK